MLDFDFLTWNNFPAAMIFCLRRVCKSQISGLHVLLMHKWEWYPRQLMNVVPKNNAHPPPYRALGKLNLEMIKLWQGLTKNAPASGYIKFNVYSISRRTSALICTSRHHQLLNLKFLEF